LLAAGAFEVVGQRSYAVGVAEAVRSLQADAVVMDVRVPPMHTTDGLHAAVELKAGLPDVGYALKERSAFCRTARGVRVAPGGTVFDSDVVTAVLGTQRSPTGLAVTTRDTRGQRAHKARSRDRTGIYRRVPAVPAYLRISARPDVP
jgi:hypothetical protein